ncbi:MAG: hypothetical protein M5U26_03255 [Planctomycetota bacterium]|nr:hypothetical protein [Planctomycetota bacterium]
MYLQKRTAFIFFPQDRHEFFRHPGFDRMDERNALEFPRGGVEEQLDARFLDVRMPVAVEVFDGRGVRGVEAALADGDKFLAAFVVVMGRADAEKSRASRRR